MRSRFWDEDGKNTRAYHTYQQPVEFASRLKVHLRGLIDRRLADGAQRSAIRWTDGAPYRGLEPFHLEHADIFFGRETQVCDLENLLRRREAEELEAAFVAVIGSSGSGKSSLVRAGLRASLTRFNLDESVALWRSAAVIPGQAQGDLFGALIRQLAQDQRALPELIGEGLELADLEQAMRENVPATFRTTIKPALVRAGIAAGGVVKLLIIVDQFEEIFTDAAIAPENRERFLEGLEVLARSGLCWVVATMRSDFYQTAQKSGGFRSLKGASGQFDLLPPGTEALQRIITEPARMAGLRFEKRAAELGGQSLAGKILEDARNQSDLLPLLSDLLLELYQHRTAENVIPFAAYDAFAGENRTGLEGVLSARAEAVFAALDPKAQETCPEILHALVTVEGESDVRRRAKLDALRDTPQKAALVDAFIAARLLTAEGDGAGARVSLAHEALLRKWDRVANWVTENRQHLRIRSRVEQAMRRWAKNAENPSLLLPEGLDLEEALSLANDAPELLAGSEYDGVRDYILRSRDHHERRARRNRRIRNTVTFFLLLLALAATAGAAFGWWKTQEALVERDKARFSEGLGWVLRAKVADQEDARQYPHNLLFAGRAIGYEGWGRNPESGDEFIRLIPPEKTREFDQARRWIEDRRAYLPFWRAPGRNVAAMGGDGRFLLAGGTGGSLVRWDLSQDSSVFLRQGGESDVTRIVLHPDGVTLTLAAGNRFEQWNYLNSEKIAAWETGEEITALGLGPDGITTAAGLAGGRLQLWRGGEVWWETQAHEGAVRSLAFHSDRATLVSGGADQTARIWYLPGKKQGTELAGEKTGGVIALSPNGEILATGGTGDGMVRLWDPASGSLLSDLARHPDETPVTALAFGPSSGRFYSADARGEVRVWDVAVSVREPRLLSALIAGGEAVSALTLGPEGRELATVNAAGEVLLWDVLGAPRELDLAGYVSRDGGWYVMDAEGDLTWKSGTNQDARNFPEQTLLALWRNPALSPAQRDQTLLQGLVEAENWTGAGVVLERLPDDADTSEMLARLVAAATGALEAGNFRVARARLEQARKLDPADAAVRQAEEQLAAASRRAEGEVFSNGIGMKLIWIEPGSFQMGSPEDEPGRDARSETPHPVTLTKGYWLAETEVTQAQWAAVMKANPDPSQFKGPDRPVEKVSYDDALAFCRQLTALEIAKGSLPDGYEYTLPSEAQWEYACRAGTTGPYNVDGADLSELGWFIENSDRETHAVRGKAPNAWGLFDMHGNVYEWCWDAALTYDAEPQTDPVIAPERGSTRVIRGGSWNDTAGSYRSAYRNGFAPGLRNYNIGFRPAVLPAGHR